MSGKSFEACGLAAKSSAVGRGAILAWMETTDTTKDMKARFCDRVANLTGLGGGDSVGGECDAALALESTECSWNAKGVRQNNIRFMSAFEEETTLRYLFSANDEGQRGLLVRIPYVILTAKRLVRSNATAEDLVDKLWAALSRDSKIKTEDPCTEKRWTLMELPDEGERMYEDRPFVVYPVREGSEFCKVGYNPFSSDAYFEFCRMMAEKKLGDDSVRNLATIAFASDEVEQLVCNMELGAASSEEGVGGFCAMNLYKGLKDALPHDTPTTAVCAMMMGLVSFRLGLEREKLRDRVEAVHSITLAVAQVVVNVCCPASVRS